MSHPFACLIAIILWAALPLTVRAEEPSSIARIAASGMPEERREAFYEQFYRPFFPFFPPEGWMNLDLEVREQRSEARCCLTGT